MSMLRFIIAPAIFVIVVAVGVTVGVYVGLEQAFQAGLTAALVFVTALYVYLTSEMVREMKEQRRTASMPVLVADSFTRKPDTVEVAIQNIGPGPALDIGVTVVDGLLGQVENAWKEGKTAGMGSILASFNLPELASKEDTGGNPKPISFTFTEGRKFLIVSECSDVYRNVIGSAREFRVLKGEQGRWKTEVTQTVFIPKVGHRIRSYT